MSLFTRRERPPAAILAGLDKDERVVSWADTSDDRVVVATSLGVWWPEPTAPRRMPWPHIDKVVWRDGVLTVTEADVVDDTLLVDRPPVSAVLTKPRDLPPMVRKRVEANIVRSELLTVGGGAVRFVARRLPGRDGVAWWARIEPGTPDTEGVRSAITARLAILRSDWDDQER
ncbi:MAG: hypothetical protein JWP39_1576 [Jatrophihabitans sp.]|nr:hypothetical protein [Jatrophihabitans sp.]